MSETSLANWLNSSLHLSKKITNIPEDFSNGYLFGEILHKHRLIPNFSSYDNSTDKKLISKNYQYLTKAFSDIGIKFNDNRRNDLINKKKGVASQLLFRIKQVLDSKFISLETLPPKSINELAEMYKTMRFPNKNEKYLKDMLNRKATSNKLLLDPLHKFGETFNNYYKDILNHIDNDNLYLKNQHMTRLNNIRSKEKKRGDFCKNLDENNLKSWNNQMNIRREFEKEKNKKYWSQCNFYKKATLNSFKNSSQENINSVNKFSSNLSKLGLDIDSNSNKAKQKTVATDIIMKRIQEKIAFEEKSRKDKERRIRKVQHEHEKLLEYTKKLKEEEEFKKFSQTHYIDREKIIKDKLEEMEKKNNDLNIIQKIHERQLIKEEKREPLEEEKYTLPYESYADNFDEKLFFTLLDKYTPKMMEDKIKSKLSKIKRIKPGMDLIMEMLLDITDEAEKYLKEHNVNLIQIPNWQNWMDLFIENIPISEYYREIEEKSHQKTEINPNEMDNENTEENLIYSYCEFFDYIHYMGNWNINIKNLLVKREKGKKKINSLELNLYDILGNDIAFMLNGGKFQIGGLKEKDLQKMANSEFEPGRLDISNITLPVYNVNNQILGEILEMYLDMKYEFDDVDFFSGANNPINNGEINNFPDIQEEKKSEENENEEDKKDEEKKEEDKKDEEKKEEDKKEEEKKEEEKKEDKKEEEKKEDKKEEENENEEKEEKNELQIENPIDDEYTFNHIPIKLCFIGHLFSGKKTTSQLISEKYPGIKVYNVGKIIKNCMETYEKITTPLEDHPKFKTMKKNQLEQLKAEREKEEHEFAYLRSIIEPYAKKEIENISDDNLINLIFYYLQKDFPIKTKEEIEEEVNKKINRINTIEEELALIREEQLKKPKAKVKEEQNFIKEKETLIHNSYKGIILDDFPQTLNQFKLFEKRCTGFIEQLDLPKPEKEIENENLLFIIDKIFHTDPKKQGITSVFDNFCLFDVSEQETLRRVNNRKIDPNTNIIYHMEDNPPPEKDKKLNERLVDVTEPTEEEVEKQLHEYDLSIQEVKKYIEIFKNIYIVKESKDKEEIVNDLCDNILSKVIEKYEQSYYVNKELNEENTNINNENNENNENINIQSSSNNQNISSISHSSRLNRSMMGEREHVAMNPTAELQNTNIKYGRRYNEVKKRIIKSNINMLFLKKWGTFNNNYTTTLKHIFVNISNIRELISNTLEKNQNDFISFLNTPSNKKELIDKFTKKYSSFKIQFSHLTTHDLVIEEFNNDLNDLTDGLWEIINERKLNAIEERKKLMHNGFFEKQILYFYENIEKMFLIETEKFLISVDIIKEFYHHLTTITNAPNLIFTNKLEEIKPNSIIRNTENLPLIKEDDDGNKVFPRIEKIYLNCMKIIFQYDYLIKQIETSDFLQKQSENLNINSSGTDNSVNRTHLSKKKKLTKIKTLRKGLNDSVTSEESKELFNIIEEQTNGVENEKNKYKYRLTIIKTYAIGTLNTILRISNELYSLLDEWIIDSVHFQNNMMNQLIERLRKIVNQNLKIQWDFELDKFNIYKPMKFKFKNNYKNPNEDVESEGENDISYRKYIEILYKLYKDVQLYTIENEFISEARFIDIVFKKHICINFSNLEETPLNKINYHQFYNFIKKMTFSIDPDKGRDDLININHIFAIMSLFPLKYLDDYDYKQIYSKIQDKLKSHCFLSKEDYFNTTLWFEGNKIFNEYYDDSEDKKAKKFNMSLKEFLYELFKKENGDVNMEDLLNAVKLKSLKSKDEDFYIDKYIDLLNKNIIY